MERERCEACGFDSATYDDAGLLEGLRGLGPRWRTLIGGAGADLRTRPAPEVWSAIEYAAHSRDVTALHAFGVEQALSVDEPSFPAIGDDVIDEAAAAYADVDPDEAVDALERESSRLAGLADRAGPDRWTRGLTIGDTRHDVRWMLGHALHDSVHHLDDVERGLAQLRVGRP